MSYMTVRRVFQCPLKKGRLLSPGPSHDFDKAGSSPRPVVAGVRRRKRRGGWWKVL